MEMCLSRKSFSALRCRVARSQTVSTCVKRNFRRGGGCLLWSRWSRCRQVSLYLCLSQRSSQPKTLNVSPTLSVAHIVHPGTVVNGGEPQQCYCVGSCLCRNGPPTAVLLFVNVYRCFSHTAHFCLIAHYLATGFDLYCRSPDNKRSNRSVCSDPSAPFTGTEIQRKCTVTHNTVMPYNSALHVSAHQNHHQAPLLQQLRESLHW
jgi:hypothetical protein